MASASAASAAAVGIVLIMIFNPGGLNDLWLDIKRGISKWPYSS